jgi:hypothetical protein
MRPPLLNADSDATVEIGMANISRAISAMIGYLGALTFHQSKMSNSFVDASHPSKK